MFPSINIQHARVQQKIQAAPATIVTKDEHGTNFHAFSPGYHAMEVERSRSVDSASLDKNTKKSFLKKDNEHNNAKPALDSTKDKVIRGIQGEFYLFIWKCFTHF